MWTLHTDSGNNVYGGQTAKNIYLGETRIVTKLNSGTNPTYQEEYYKQYFYHSDHLGSASLISDYKGDEYQRIEYTPYGETWVEKTSNTGLEFLPYKFTAKELDEETGLYYYGARYLDPKYSRWLSTDPALGEYLTPDENKKYGVFDYIKLNLYHYGHNNPIMYIDPDGRKDFLSYLYELFQNAYGTGGADYLFNNDPSIKFMCTVDAAANGNVHAQAQLKYAFYEAGREMLTEISEKSGYASLAFLAVGCPEGAGVFGVISMTADGILTVDDIIHGNIREGLTEGAILVASFAAGKGAEKIVQKVAGISIHVGKTGRYYEIGRKGAIKTEAALRKLVAKDIASGYFGQNIPPELASQIVEKAAEGFKEALENEE